MGLALAALVAAPALAQGVPPLGTQPLSSETAAKFFRVVCLLTAPGHGAAFATLEANGFAENPETGTYYHPTLDLSFHVEDRCSMVFGSDAAPAEIGLAFGAAAGAAGGGSEIAQDPVTGETWAAGPAGTEMIVGPFEAPTGQSYYHAVLQRAR